METALVKIFNQRLAIPKLVEMWTLGADGVVGAPALPLVEQEADQGKGHVPPLTQLTVLN